jgi:hypothetical protein
MPSLLFEPDRHEALSGTAWDAARARAAIVAIARDLEQSRLAEGHWPAHPLDVPGPEKSLYTGSAGVLWALWTLQREGAVRLAVDPAESIGQVHAAYLAEPDTGSVVPSYLLGEAGVLLAWWRMTGSSVAAERLFASIESNIGNPTNESLWAAPGTMVAAWHLWLASGEDRWRALFLANVEQVWRTWHFDAKAGCHLWTQDMYGEVVQYLGAGHGFAGNVYPLLRGMALLDDARRELLLARCVETLRALAIVEDGAVNWPPGTYVPRPGGAKMLVQWCHGAPGMVTALADFPRGHSAEMDAMLIGAGHAVWRAGPLTKGYGICHGTAGNGYAFLKLHQRTGDPLWLERARAFAMHAIAQSEHMRQHHGQGRYTLWTGDAGLALYLWHCLEGRSMLPALDAV